MKLLSITLNQSLAGLIGIGFRASEAVSGFEAVKRAILQGKTKLVLIDETLAENSSKKIISVAQRNKKPVVVVEKGKPGIDLISVSGSKIVALLEGGVAKGFIDKLKQENQWQ